MRAAPVVLLLALLGAASTPQDALTPDAIDALAGAKGDFVDDATFLRRASLDLTGTIPSADVVEKFLADPAADKREKQLDALIGGDDFVRYWTQVWYDAFLGKTNEEIDYEMPPFRQYLRAAVRDNTPYDALVREMIAVEGMFDEHGSAGFLLRWGRADYVNAAEMTAAVSRVLLGVQIRCAQCHDHPFEPWTREQFWSLAAFFGRTRLEYAGEMKLNENESRSRWEVSEKFWGDVEMPPAQRPDVREPAFLDGAKPAFGAGRQMRRAALAAWIASPDNPYFSKALANRLWAHFFGRGLDDPIEHFSPKKQTPELLDKLAREFVRSGFDLRRMMKLIVSTEAYRRAMPPRPLSTYQLFTSIARATALSFEQQDLDSGEGTSGESNPETMRARAEQNAEGYLYDFARAQSPVEKTLAGFNGSLVTDGIGGGRWRGRLGSDPLRSLFIAALGRAPKDDERKLFVESQEDEAYEDVLWVLLNSSEFRTNR